MKILLILIGTTWINLYDVQVLQPTHTGGCAVFIKHRIAGIDTEKDCEAVALQIHNVQNNVHKTP